MIDTLLNLLFRCSHKRTTWPITPVSRAGVPHGATYVVCLDCGKQFAYDLEKMCIVGPVEASPHVGVLPPGMPKARKTKLEYALLASVLPAAWIVGKALQSPKKPEKAAKSEKPGGGST